MRRTFPHHGFFPFLLAVLGTLVALPADCLD